MPSRTEPPVSETAAREAIDRIYERRERAADPSLERFDRDNPLKVVNHVLREQRGLPDHVVDEDLLDALWILGYLRHSLSTTLDRFEDELIELGMQRKITRERLKVPLGLRSAIGVTLRRQRTQAAQMGLARNERLLRQTLRTLREKESGTRETPESRWLDHNGLKLVDAAADLVKVRREHSGLINDALAEGLSGLHGLIQDVSWPLRPETFNSLRAISSWIVHVLQPDIDERLRQTLGARLSEALELATTHLKVRGD